MMFFPMTIRALSLSLIQYGAVPLETAAENGHTVGGRSQCQPSEQGDDRECDLPCKEWKSEHFTKPVDPSV